MTFEINVFSGGGDDLIMFNFIPSKVSSRDCLEPEAGYISIFCGLKKNVENFSIPEQNLIYKVCDVHVLEEKKTKMHAHALQICLCVWAVLQILHCRQISTTMRAGRSVFFSCSKFAAEFRRPLR